MHLHTNDDWPMGCIYADNDYLAYNSPMKGGSNINLSKCGKDLGKGYSIYDCICTSEGMLFYNTYSYIADC